MVRTIAVITGTRAEYGLLKSVMSEIRGTEGLSLKLIITGMHLSRTRGHTIDEIRRDGFVIDDVVDIPEEGDSGASMARSLGYEVLGITQSLERLDPDILLVLGDRVEAIAGALSGAYTNRVVAHIHGGEVSKGCVDESARHAITKLAHIHFAATEESAKRIVRLGERPENVHVVGAPGLDAVLSGVYTSPEVLANRYGIDLRKPLIIAIQHPVTQQESEVGEQMRVTLDALRVIGEQTVLVYPNTDVGGQRMLRVIMESKLPSIIRPYANIPHSDFLGLMKVASVIVGNSSSGIIEAPSFGLPAVNIGIRQEGRQRGANVIDVPHDRERIVGAVRHAITDKAFRRKVARAANPYGDGKASRRIVEILSKVVIDDRLLQKQITY